MCENSLKITQLFAKISISFRTTLDDSEQYNLKEAQIFDLKSSFLFLFILKFLLSNLYSQYGA